MDEIHVALAAEQIGTLWGIPITNTLLMTFISMAVLIVLAVFLYNKMSLIPSRLQTLIEMIVTYIYDYVKEVLEREDLAKRYFPLLVTIFLFVFMGNLLQFIPGVGSVGFFHDAHFEPLFRSQNTDLNVTLSLTLIVFFVIEWAGIRELGFFHYMGKFVNLKSPLGFAVGIIDIFSEAARLISFSFRLFGNIFAGEVVILVIIYFAPVLAPVPMMAFEVFVGFIQAAIFSLLTLFFIKIAISEAH